MTVVDAEIGMRRMTAKFFKAHCLAVMNEVQAKRETVLITKHGKPVAKLVPVREDKDDIYGFLAGRVTIVGDIISPALSPEEWGELN
jgi:prevent-host-death family protein